MPPVGAPFIASSFACLNTDFVVSRGFAELLTPDPILEFHATSLLFLMLRLGLRSFVAIASSSDVVSKMPQTMHSVVHLSASC